MAHSKAAKTALIALMVYSAAMPFKIPIPAPQENMPAPTLQIPLWIFPAIAALAWLLEGLKADALHIRRTNICLAVSGAIIPLILSLLLISHYQYFMPFAIGLVIMAGLMYKLSKPDFLRGNIRFKLGYALVFSYGIAALAALLMYGSTVVAFNIQFLSPLAAAVGTVGILVGNIATGLELLSQAATPASFKHKIILGNNGARDVLWAPIYSAILLFTFPEIYAMLEPVLLALIPH